MKKNSLNYSHLYNSPYIWPPTGLGITNRTRLQSF